MTLNEDSRISIDLEVFGLGLPVPITYGRIADAGLGKELVIALTAKERTLDEHAHKVLLGLGAVVYAFFCFTNPRYVAAEMPEAPNSIVMPTLWYSAAIGRETPDKI